VVRPQGPSTSESRSRGRRRRTSSVKPARRRPTAAPGRDRARDPPPGRPAGGTATDPFYPRKRRVVHAISSRDPSARRPALEFGCATFRPERKIGPAALGRIAPFEHAAIKERPGRPASSHRDARAPVPAIEGQSASPRGTSATIAAGRGAQRRSLSSIVRSREGSVGARRNCSVRRQRGQGMCPAPQTAAHRQSTATIMPTWSARRRQRRLDSVCSPAEGPRRSPSTATPPRRPRATTRRSRKGLTRRAKGAKRHRRAP